MGIHCIWTLASQAAQLRETQAIERVLAEGTPTAKERLQAQPTYEPQVPVETDFVDATQE